MSDRGISKMGFKVLLLCAFFMRSASCQEYKIVTTKYGDVRGQVRSQTPDERVDEQMVASFLGIPYAKPPLGSLRFKRPEPPDPWKETLETVKMPPACIQHSQHPFPWYDSEPGQSEDCLYLNIWTPFNVSIKRPVKVYIHGGGFSSGSNRMGYYDGRWDTTDYVEPDEYHFSDLRHSGGFLGIVDVVINYRLGALGFLTSGSEDAPGNVGLYDMLAALHWVRDNIGAFGGDPSQISVFGQGAGAIAVSLFCVSPLAGGLFGRALMSGGNFLTIRENKFLDNLKLSQRLIEAVGCNSTSLISQPKETIDCMRDVNATQLAGLLSSFNPTSPYSFYPQYEQDDLFPINPAAQLACGRVNNVSGIFLDYTSDEGSYLLTSFRPDQFGLFGEKDFNPNATFANIILRDYLRSRRYPQPEKVAKLILEKNTNLTMRKILFDGMGDESVVCPMLYFAEKFAELGRKVYVYESAEIPPYNPWAKWMGKAHFSSVQNQFVHGDGRLEINGKSYNFTHREKDYNFFNKLLQGFFIYNAVEFREGFSKETREYSYNAYTLEPRSNPSQYNCEIFRTYQYL